MSFVDRLQFWRKKDEYSFDTGLPPDLGTVPPTSYDPTGSGSPGGFGSTGGLPEIGEHMDRTYDKPSFEKPSYGTPLGFEKQNGPVSGPSRDLEIISLKLDAIKAELDAVNQRLVRVEKLAELNVKGGKATSRDIWATY